MLNKIFAKLSYLLRRKLFFIICLLTSKISSKSFPLAIKLFKFSISQLGDSIYFDSHKKRNLLNSCISKIKSLEKDKIKFDNIKTNKEIEIIIKNLNNYGIHEDLKISIPQQERDDFVDYINKANYYDSHVITKKATKKAYEKPKGAYKSYDYHLQLNNPTLLNLCLNPRLLKIAELYLGCTPNIDGINTFVTLPKKVSFTHGFHRDLNNIKQLVIFIYWTKTSSDNGAFEYIKHTHKPSNYLTDILKRKKSIFLPDFDKFAKSTTPGYGKCDQYLEIFKKEIVSTFGNECKINACDPFGLHRGTSVKAPRIVTWIRYGSMTSRQTLVTAEEMHFKKAILNDKCKEIFLKSDFKNLLNDFIDH